MRAAAAGSLARGPTDAPKKYPASACFCPAVAAGAGTGRAARRPRPRVRFLEGLGARLHHAC
eukprot:3028990-Alexandrium_andersonii.AAC.1